MEKYKFSKSEQGSKHSDSIFSLSMISLYTLSKSLSSQTISSSYCQWEFSGKRIPHYVNPSVR